MFFVPALMSFAQAANDLHLVPPEETCARLSRMVVPSVLPPTSAASAISVVPSYASSE